MDSVAAARTAVVTWAVRIVQRLRWAWTSWPGIILRWTSGLLLLSTLVLNAVVVPYTNARLVPDIERSISDVTGRAVSLEGIRWVSPPGVFGMGPLVSLNGVSIGPRVVEQSDVTVAQASVSLSPLESLLQRRPVVNVELLNAHVTVRQASNYSWFGYPVDTAPSARDFVPGLGGGGGTPGGAGGSVGGVTGQRPGRAPAARGGGLQSGAAAARYGLEGAGHEAWESSEAAPELERLLVGERATSRRRAAALLPVEASGTGAACGEQAAGGAALSGSPAAEGNVCGGDALAERRASSGGASTSGRNAGGAGRDSAWRRRIEPLRQRAAARGDTHAADVPAMMASVSAAAAPAPQAAPTSAPLVSLRRIAIVDSTVHGYVTGDPYPRRFTNVNAEAKLGYEYNTLELIVEADAFMREAGSFVCTMPMNPAARNLRHCTPGGEIAPINSYPVTQQGPSPANLAKMQREARDRVAGVSPSPPAWTTPYNTPAPAVVNWAPPAAVAPELSFSSLKRSGSRTRTAAAPGGRLRVAVSVKDILTEDVWPTCDVSVQGDNLHAPLVDRLLEIPMDIYDGRLDGTVDLHLETEEQWIEFPSIAGRVQARSAAFHFWDAPDDFSSTNVTLMFDKDRMYLHNAQGTYGAVSMTVGGDIGLNPETGHYSVQAKVPSVDVNALRATLGARPLPYPVAGAVGGSVQCYGPLEQPVFMGNVETRPMTAIAQALAERTDALDTLRAARADGHTALLAYDKVPFSAARGVFTMDTTSSQLSVQTAQATPLGGGVVKGTGRMNVDPRAEADPNAVRLEFVGEDLNPVSAAGYAPALKQSLLAPGALGPVNLRGRMSGSHVAPVIKMGASLPNVNSECLAVLSRDRASFKIKAPSLNASATVQTEFPPFDLQKTALTQKAAIALREPRFMGGSVHADVRSLDVLPVLKSLQLEAEAGGDSVLGGAGLDPSRLQVNGQMKLWLQAAEDPKEQADGFALSGDVGDDTGGNAAQQPPPEFFGKVELKSFRVNQLQLARSLEGSFTLRDDRFDLQASGSRHTEKLVASLRLPSADASALPLQQTAADAAARTRVPDQVTAVRLPASSGSRRQLDESDEATGPADERSEAAGATGPDDHFGPLSSTMARANFLELRCGHLTVMGNVDDSMTQMEAKIANLPLDDLEIASLRGTVKEFDAAVDLRSQSGHAKLDILEPRFEGLKSHSLHAEAFAEDGVIRLSNTSLKQDNSSYVIHGQVTLPKPAPLPPPAAAAAADPEHHDAAPGPPPGSAVDQAARSNGALPAGSLSTQSSTHALLGGGGDAQQVDANAGPAEDVRKRTGGKHAVEETPLLDSAAAPTTPDTASAEPHKAESIALPPEGGPISSDVRSAAQAVSHAQADSPTQAEAETDADAASNRQQPSAEQLARKMSWWVKVIADGQLQDIMPAAELASRPKASVVDMERARTAFIAAVKDATWTLGDPATSAAAYHGESVKHSQSAPQLPGLSALVGRIRGEVTAFGGEDGTSRMHFDVAGNDWRWGQYVMDDLAVVGDLDGRQGLQLEKLEVNAEGAVFSIKGRLLGPEQDATIKLDSFPLDVLQPLVQGALPNLQAPKPEQVQSFGPVTRPLYLLQRQLRRAADALPLPHPQPREHVPRPSDLSPAPIRGELHMTGRVSGSIDAPAGNLTMRVDKATLGTVPLSEASARAVLDGDGTAALRARLVPAGPSGAVEARCRVHLPDGGNLNAQLDVRDAGMAVLSELGGDAAKWVDGRAAVTVNVTGSVAAPEISGRAQLSKGHVLSPVLKSPLTGIQGSVRIDGGQLRVHKLQAQSGKTGSFEVSGSLPLVQPPNKVRAERLKVSVTGLEVRAPAVYTGLLESQLTVRGSVLAPHVGGDVRLSKGSVTVASSSSAPYSEEGQRAAGAPPAAPWEAAASQNRTVSALQASAAGAQALRAQSGVQLATLENFSSTLRNPPKEGVESVTLDRLSVLLGPDLRFTVPILVQLDLSGALQLDGPATPDSVTVLGEVKLGTGIINVLATQFNVDRSHRSAITFTGEPGLNPLVDVALVSGDFRISCQARLSDAPNNVTFTSAGDGAPQSMGSNEAAMLLEHQLKSFMLLEDGQLAVQNLAMNALSTMLPRIEGSGQWGKARWRLVGSPTVPLFSSTSDAAGLVLGAQAEAEMAYGEKLTASLSSRHLADAKVSATYQVAPRLRLCAAFTAPRSNVTVMMQYGQEGLGGALV